MSGQPAEPQAKDSLGTVARRGLLGRCPRCGKGKLFKGVLDIADQCDSCGLQFFGHDAGDGPAVAGIFVLGTAVVALAIWVEFTFMPPLWLHAALWTPIIVGGAVGLLRPLKGLAVALQYRYRAVDEEEKLGGQ
jgi:uncharacterized protein (DUF983 family)